METTNKEFEAVFDQVHGSRDALSVRRVFGDPYELDGVTVIPVARVMGGAGGGGGTGEGPDGKGTGSGSGTGFGLSARGIGVYGFATARSSGSRQSMSPRWPRAGRCLAPW